VHENADITKDQKEADELLSAVEATQSSVGGAGGKSKEEVVLELPVEFATKLPTAFDIELARYKYPVMYLESMNSVFHQETIQFNKLTDVIRSSLVTVQKTLRGLVVMSADIDKLITNIFQSKMPVMWAPYSYPTMKPVSSYFQDLLDRLKMLQNWFDVGPPPRFWISGFYFTHAFLTCSVSLLHPFLFFLKKP